MKIQLRHFQEFESWQEAAAFLQANALHFLYSESYPELELDADLQKRFVILGPNFRSGFQHVPKHASKQDVLAFCRILAGEPSEEADRFQDLAQFIQTFCDELDKDPRPRIMGPVIAAAICELLTCESCAVLVSNEERDGLRFLGASSRRQDLTGKLQHLEVPKGVGLAGWVAETGESLLLSDVQNDDRFSPKVDQKTGFGTREALANPVMIGSEIIGVLLCANKQDGAFCERDLAFLALVAVTVAVFLERAKLNEQLQSMERNSDKAQIATAVLHNIGNVLNSLSVSCSLVSDKIGKSKSQLIHMANQMIQEHKDDLGSFFTEHAKGKMLPEFFDRASVNLKKEQGDFLSEIQKMSQNVNLMQDIIETQQTIAKLGSSKTQDLIDVVYEALRVNSQLLEEQQVHIERSFLTGKPVQAQRAKLVHVLINLIKNAIEAMAHKVPEERQLFIATGEDEEGWIYLSIRDTGCGIKPENREKLFSHGFTTKDHGHGFGLSYSAKAIEEMGGRIEVESDGEDCGTTFFLSFPPVPMRLD